MYLVNLSIIMDVEKSIAINNEIIKTFNNLIMESDIHLQDLNKLFEAAKFNISITTFELNRIMGRIKDIDIEIDKFFYDNITKAAKEKRTDDLNIDRLQKELKKLEAKKSEQKTLQKIKMAELSELQRKEEVYMFNLEIETILIKQYNKSIKRIKKNIVSLVKKLKIKK